MLYFKTKQDLAFLKEFKRDVEDYFDLVDGYPTKVYRATNKSIQVCISGKREPTVVVNEKQLREKITKNLIEATKLSHIAAAGVISIETNPYQSVLQYVSNGNIPKHQDAIDTINCIIGQYERQLAAEWKRLVNPLFWMETVFTFILRIPYKVLKCTGFNVGEIEKHLWGPLINLVFWLGTPFYIWAVKRYFTF